MKRWKEGWPFESLRGLGAACKHGKDSKDGCAAFSEYPE